LLEGILLGFDGIHRADVVTGAAIDTLIEINYVFTILLTDGIHWTDIITRATIVALFSNVMLTHLLHLLFPGKLR
jgi:hypothetical protein